MKRSAIIGLIFLLGLATRIEAGGREVLISGKTMGTTYHVKVVAGTDADTTALETRIVQRLEEVNQSMSTYRPDSEISRFNRSAAREEAFAVSADFLQVMSVAGRLYHLSGGAWDGTVYPLVSLWGFGGTAPLGRVPSEEQIQDLLPRVGFDKIRISPAGFLSKTVDGVTLDLASIAKGFGVDRVAAVVREAGFENYLVEIGGEVYAAGRRADGRRWRIGINRPSAGAPLDAVYRVVELQDRAFATSGDYRNFFVHNGVRYSHVIDPRTGRPVSNGVVSVSVVSDTCTFADGLATAVMVMGPRAGVDLVERIPNTECLVVVDTPGSGLRDVASSGFRFEAP